MFQALQERLEDAFKKLRGQSKISESNVADAMRDIRMALLEAETGKVVQVYIPPTKASWAPSAIRWNEDGQTLATAFSDGTIAVYDRNAAKPRQVLRGHRGGISCLRFYGEKLLSASDDGTCLMWELHR